jgi:hypothetical protein
MKRVLFFVFCFLILQITCRQIFAQSPPIVVVSESGFPSGDSAVASSQQLSGWVPGARRTGYEKVSALSGSV